MMTKKIGFSIAVPAAVLAACGWISGCGKLETGAHTEVSVTLKSAEFEATGEAGGDTEPTGGGDTETPAASSGPGVFSGRLSFSGTSPGFPPLVAQSAAVKDAEFCSANAVPDESLVVGPSGGLANVFIYLDKAPSGYEAEAPAVQEVIFDQKNCTFLPHALFVQVGQTVKILTSDGCAHNTNVKVVRNKPFNQVVSGYEKEGVPLTYEKQESSPISVACDFHAWMSAQHLVLDHPFGAVTDENGQFEIAGLPPGKYKFKVWHERGKFLERSLNVTIKSGETATLEKAYGPGDLGL